MKKQQKKGKKGAKSGGLENKTEDNATAVKDDKEEEGEAPPDTEDNESPSAQAEQGEGEGQGGSSSAQGDQGEGNIEPPSTQTEQGGEDGDNTTPLPEPTAQARRESLSTIQSRQRSESFRYGSVGSGSKSPILPSISAEDEVQEIYRKQHTRIEELERENKTLKASQAQHETRLQKNETELEQLREKSAAVAELKIKAASADEKSKELDTLVFPSTNLEKSRVADIDLQNSEITSLKRQLTQAQQAATTPKSTKSNTSPNRDIEQQLAQKTSTIESLELELSNLRNQYQISQSTNEANEATIKHLEDQVKTAQAATEAAKQETETLKASVQKTVEDGKDKKNSEEDPAALHTRITVLESDLRTAQTSTTEATSRATSLEQKIEALTKLHKDATATSTAREKEIFDLKARITNFQTKKSPKPDDAEESLSDLEDEEREKLVTRVRELEAENFDLRRGVWLDKRQSLQPGLEDDAVSPAYEDVDLNGGNPYAFSASGSVARAGMPARQGSTFQDVLQSGISAFTGRDRRVSVSGEPRPAGRGRGQSLGLLSEDGFDEDAFREAQEEEGKRRIERIREVKRGLDDWRGWRVDLVDMRQGGLGGNAWTGPVFDV